MRLKPGFALKLFLFASLACTSAAAFAQYTIERALYGTANHNVDVTDELRQIAASKPTFRMGNSTFGVDPDHGHLKALRIFARDPNGQPRMFEYQEGSTVNGSMFNGWNSGAWGSGSWNGNWNGPGGGSWNNGQAAPGGWNSNSGGYSILSARYGTAQRNIDVTEKLEKIASKNRIFEMGNSTFDDDPDPGQPKVLRIYARGPNGQTRMFEYPEGSTVDGSQFNAWSSGSWGSPEGSGRW